MTRNSMIPAAELRRLSQRLVAMQDRLDLVEKSQRATQLSNSSIEGGFLVIRDVDGLPRGYVGMQPDGTTGVRVVNGPPPSRPNTPELTSIMAGIAASWNGELVDALPGDFSHVNVYVSGAGADFIHGPSNLIGALSRAGSIPVAPLPSTSYWARFVAYNTSGKESEPSFTAGPVTPSQVVAQELLDGIVTEVKLATDAVTEAKLAAGAVTETKVADDAISTPKLVVGAVQAEKIATGAVQADKIAAGAVTTAKLDALAVTADQIAANAINAGHVQAGAVTADKLAANLVVAGTPGGDRVEISQVNGIEQYLGGERTLSVPPDGDAIFGGSVHVGTAAQYIAVLPNAGGFPRIDMVDNVGTRQITFVYQADAGGVGKGEMYLQRELQSTRVVDGGSINFGAVASFFSHSPNNVLQGQLRITDAGDVTLSATNGVTITAGATNFQIANNAGARVRSSGGDIFIDSGNGNGSIQMYSDGFLQIVTKDGAGVHTNNFTAKAFVIPHPVDDDRWLVHGCTETPDAMVEYTGTTETTDGQAVVELPPYFEALTREDSRQTQVTQILPDTAGPDGDVLYRVAASTPKDGRFRIACDGPDGTRVAWKVTAPREVAGGFAVEPLRSEVTVTGDGPYRYIVPS